MIGRLLKSSTASVAIIGLSACASSPEPRIGPASISPVSELGQSEYTYARPQTYRLRTSDVLSVNVFREADLSTAAVRVGLDGNISLPLLGTLKAGGMTTAELEKDVAARLSRAGLKTPMVSVNIAEYASHLVTVEGSVAKPGVFPFQPGARLSAAIAMAEGPNRVANLNQVAVFREVDNGISVAKFDYQAVSQGTMLDPILRPNDRVVVGTSGLSVFWQDFLKTVPALGVFATVALDNN
ncbi:MAG: polysaccharide biosynthesis/export family protein [Pseudomonadota bacterium]